MFTVWILGEDRLLGLQGLRLALGVDGADPELVLSSGGEVVELGAGLGAVRAPGRNPEPSVGIQLLHLVVLDGASAVVLGALPLELASSATDVGHLDGAFGRHGLVGDGHAHGHLVLARAVSGLDGVLAGVIAHRLSDHQLGVVVHVGDVDVAVGVQLAVVEGPGDGRRRLAGDVAVVLDHGARGHGDVAQVLAVDPRRNYREGIMH